MAPRFHYFVARLTSSFGLKEVESLTAPPIKSPQMNLGESGFYLGFAKSKWRNRRRSTIEKSRTASGLHPELRFIQGLNHFRGILAGEPSAVGGPHHFLELSKDFFIIRQSHHLTNQSSN